MLKAKLPDPRVLITAAALVFIGLIWWLLRHGHLPLSDKEVLWFKGAELKGLEEEYVSAKLEGPRFNDGDIIRLMRYRTLELISLKNSCVTDFGVKLLGEMKNLHRLDLSGTKVTGEGLQAIPDLPKLWELSLEHCPNLGPDDLIRVCQNPQIKELDFSVDHWEPEGLSRFVAGAPIIPPSEPMGGKRILQGFPVWARCSLGTREVLLHVRLTALEPGTPAEWCQEFQRSKWWTVITQVEFHDRWLQIAGEVAVRWAEMPSEELAKPHLERLAVVAALPPSVKSITIHGFRDHDRKYFADLASLPHLEELSIFGQLVRADDLAELSQCQSLKTLTLATSSAEIRELANRADAPQFSCTEMVIEFGPLLIRPDHPQFEMQVKGALAMLFPNLERLTLRDVHGAELDSIRGLKHLKQLRVSLQPGTDLMSCSDLSELEELTIKFRRYHPEYGSSYENLNGNNGLIYDWSDVPRLPSQGLYPQQPENYWAVEQAIDAMAPADQLARPSAHEEQQWLSGSLSWDDLQTISRLPQLHRLTVSCSDLPDANLQTIAERLGMHGYRVLFDPNHSAYQLGSSYEGTTRDFDVEFHRHGSP